MIPQNEDEANNSTRRPDQEQGPPPAEEDLPVDNPLTTTSSTEQPPRVYAMAMAAPSHSASSHRRKSRLYWIVLVCAIFAVICFTGTVFSCRAFVVEEDTWMDAYGYRGYIHNVTGDCIAWKDDQGTTNDYWKLRMSNMYTMGIVGCVLLVVVLGLWILEGTNHCWAETTMPVLPEADVVPTAHHMDSSNNIPDSLQVVEFDIPKQRFLCGARKAHLIPTLVATLFIIYGFLSVSTILGHCDNIPPLGMEPGLGCGFAMWSILGMATSLAVCVLGCCILSCYRRDNYYYY